MCICTEPFVSAARAHARALNWADCEPVAIPHPLQTLEERGVESRADSIVTSVLVRLGVREGD